MGNKLQPADAYMPPQDPIKWKCYKYIPVHKGF